MRVLIVDDEAAARRRLAALLAELDEELVGEAQDGLEALRLARERRPELVLLDIAMPEVDGFDVAANLAEPRPLIVFQTAHGEHALRAFEHEALDYVLKPVTRERLQKVLARARERLAGRQGLPLAGLGAELFERLRRATAAEAAAAAPRRILVRDRAGHRLVALRDVARFEAEEGLVWAHEAGGRHLVESTLSDLEQRLDGSFVRASRAELVNAAHVVRLVPGGDGSALLELGDGSRVRVSRRRAADVRRALEA